MSCVVCNGLEENAIINIVAGKKIGTFFTHMEPTGTPVEIQAMQGIVFNLIYILIFFFKFEGFLPKTIYILILYIGEYKLHQLIIIYQYSTYLGYITLTL